ncbi:MAG: C4-type zinc ribbon domain-containing protein [Treponema sp.]|jgi:predicted  nucleic acid-binding Zn-ribbon protein|nr:C4-type zinc ribbon domain-containing protein [Treponema sp.]
MEKVFETLKILQDILTEKIELEQEIQEIPKTLTTQEEVLARRKKSFIEKNQDYEKAKTAEAEYRNSLFEAESKREKAEKNMESISTQREYEALDKEIEDAAGKEQEYRTKLQREVRLISDLDDDMKEIQALIEQQEEELEKIRRAIEAETAEKETKLKDLSEKESKLASDLGDPDVLFKFERIIRNKMGRGIVAIKGGVCMGCHMILSAQFANNVRMGEEIIFCPYCSRILFYEESDQSEEDFFSDEDSGSLSDLDDMEEEEYDEAEEEEERVSSEYDE